MFQIAKKAKLQVTGERMVSELSEISFSVEDIYDHLHRYAKALDLVKGKDVLDIASGEGYGSNLLSNEANQVFGVDISSEAIDFATSKYQKENLKFLVGSADSIPLDDDSVDVVVSFETLEHHDRHDEMLKEIKRVLRPGGIMVMSTPDVDTYTNKGEANHFHVKELNLQQFKELVDRYFLHRNIYFQRYIQASFIIAEGKANSFKEFRGDFEHIDSENGIKYPYYNICIASDSALEPSYNSIFHNYKPNMFSGEILKRLLKQERDNIINSKTYKLGNWVASPIKAIRSVFK